MPISQKSSLGTVRRNAVVYARYSTDNQNPDSIEVQVEKCTQWCSQNGISVLSVFADEATSGMKSSRPQYDTMMGQLRHGLADTVVIYDQSRMFRKMTAWFAFRDELTSMGVSVVSVTQPMIGKDLRDPTNFLTEGSMALFNQIWALQTRQKVMEKMRFMAKNGQHTGGKPALGYKVQDGKLVVCEEEAATVRRIFAEYAAGKTYRDIIAGLNRDGLKTKRGNPFGSNSLHDLLHNEKYIGTLVYGQSPYREDGTRNTHSKDGNAIRVENAIPAIVDKELFDKVQEKMTANKRQQGGRPPQNREYPLKGKVFCASCKSAMTISISQGKYYYYKCNQKKRRHDCDAANISADVLERTVAETVRDVLRHRENAEKLIRILREQSSVIQSSAVTQLQALIAEEKDVISKLDNATNAVLSGLSSPTILAKIQELEHRKTEISAQMRTLKASVDASAIPENRLREIIDKFTAAEYTDLSVYLSIVYRVEVGKDAITIWTILDANPDGTYDFDAGGVLLTPGVPSGVPKKQIPNWVSAFLILRVGLERPLKKRAGSTFLGRGRVPPVWDASRRDVDQTGVFSMRNLCWGICFFDTSGGTRKAVKKRAGGMFLTVGKSSGAHSAQGSLMQRRPKEVPCAELSREQRD